MSGWRGMAFVIDDRAVRLDCPRALAVKIAAMVPAYAVPGYRGEPMEIIRIEEVPAGWIVDAWRGHRDRFVDEADLLVALEYLIVFQLLGLAGDRPQLHASGAQVGDTAVLALGEAGAGKSSLATRWSHAGHPVLGDDIVFLEGHDTVKPFKRLFRVHPDRLDGYEIPAAHPLHTLGDEDESWYDPSWGGGWCEGADVGTIAFVRFAEGSDTKIDTLSKPEVLALLSASLMPGGVPAEGCFDELLHLAERVRAVRVTFGDSADAARALETL